MSITNNVTVGMIWKERTTTTTTKNNNNNNNTEKEVVKSSKTTLTTTTTITRRANEKNVPVDLRAVCFVRAMLCFTWWVIFVQNEARWEKNWILNFFLKKGRNPKHTQQFWALERGRAKEKKMKATPPPPPPLIWFLVAQKRSTLFLLLAFGCFL